MRRRTYLAFLRQGWRDRHRRGAAQDYSTGDLPAPRRPVQVHRFLLNRIAGSQHAVRAECIDFVRRIAELGEDFLRMLAEPRCTAADFRRSA
jgi:hypothetical protein